MYEFLNIIYYIFFKKRQTFFPISNSNKVTSPTIALKYEDDSNDGGIAEKI